MPRSRNAYSRTFPDIKHFKSMQRSRSVDRRASLTTLDEDVTLQISCELAVDDVISLRKVGVQPDLLTGNTSTILCRRRRKTLPSLAS